MKNFLLCLVVFAFTSISSCNSKKEIELKLKSDNTTWFAYKDFYFEKELIICGIDSVSQIKLIEKVSQNDTIYKSDNGFIYSSRPSEVGHFEIKGKIQTLGTEIDFSQNISVIPQNQPIAFNKKNALNLKMGVENEVEIFTGFPKKYQTLKTNNGKIFERNDKTIIVPDKTGNCDIEIDVSLPSNEKFMFKNVTFKVTN